MNPTVRRVIILGAPAVLGILDIFHPTFSDAFDGISANLNWWITLHILQLPLFCLLALSVYLLLDKVQGRWAVLSKIALGMFVAFYPALDAILGIGGGILASYAQGTTGFAQALTSATIEGYFTSNLTLLVSALGSFAWSMAILLAVVALARTKQPRWLMAVTMIVTVLAMCYYELMRINLIPEILSVDNLSRLVLLLAIALGILARPHLTTGLLVMAAYLFAADHAPPTGPAAMACYFLAALQLEFFPEKAPLVEQDVTPADEENVPADDVASEEKTVPEKDVVPDPS